MTTIFCCSYCCYYHTMAQPRACKIFGAYKSSCSDADLGCCLRFYNFLTSLKMILMWLAYGIYFEEQELKLPRLIHNKRTDDSLEKLSRIKVFRIVTEQQAQRIQVHIKARRQKALGGKTPRKLEIDRKDIIDDIREQLVKIKNVYMKSYVTEKMR